MAGLLRSETSTPAVKCVFKPTSGPAGENHRPPGGARQGRLDPRHTYTSHPPLV
jgi:hypothetical protein